MKEPSWKIEESNMSQHESTIVLVERRQGRTERNATATITLESRMSSGWYVEVKFRAPNKWIARARAAELAAMICNMKGDLDLEKDPGNDIGEPLVVGGNLSIVGPDALFAVAPFFAGGDFDDGNASDAIMDLMMELRESMTKAEPTFSVNKNA